MCLRQFHAGSGVGPPLILCLAQSKVNCVLFVTQQGMGNDCLHATYYHDDTAFLFTQANSCSFPNSAATD